MMPAFRFSWFYLAWFAICPLLTVILPVLGHPKEVSLGTALVESFEPILFVSVFNFPWFMGLAGLTRWYIARGRTSDKHAKAALYASGGALVGLCMSYVFLCFIYASNSLLADSVGYMPGFGETVFLVPVGGILGMSIGALVGLLVEG